MPTNAPPRALPGALPVFPLKGAVLLPGVPHVFEVGRERSIQALQWSHARGRPVFVITQRNEIAYDPGSGDLLSAGTVAEITLVQKLPASAIKVTVVGSTRAWLRKFDKGTTHATAEVEAIPQVQPGAEAIPLVKALKQKFDDWTVTQKTVPTPFGTIMVPAVASATILKIHAPGVLADTVGAYIPLAVPSKQKLLELANPVHRLELLLEKFQNPGR